MSRLNYLKGFIKYFANNRVSFFSLVDNNSQIHDKARLCRNTKSFHSKIGAYSYIAPKSELVYVNIGKFCSIGRNCLIGLPKHSIDYLSTSPIFTSDINALKIKWADMSYFEEFNFVNIGNDVWIGSNVIINGGVNIGNGVIIGAGAIVTKDIPDYSIAVGVPAKVIKSRFDKNIIDILNKIKWWDMSEDDLKQRIKIFQKKQVEISDIINEFLTGNKTIDEDFYNNHIV